MEPRWPEVRALIGLRDLVAQSLELRPADIGQDDAVRPHGSLGVEEHGQLETFGDALAERSGQLDALVHRRLAQRHERDYVDRADARVLTLCVFMSIRSMASATAASMASVTADAGPAECQHAAVVVAIHRLVEQEDARLCDSQPAPARRRPPNVAPRRSWARIPPGEPSGRV